MEHLAIMKKEWKLTEKIITGEKRIESRWYKNKYPPIGKIRAGDKIYFKDSGTPVNIKAEVERVIEFSDLNPKKVQQILEQYGKEDGIDEQNIPKFFKIFKNKRYCLLIFLKNPKRIEPFEINKTGYGTMSSWICTNSIEEIIK